MINFITFAEYTFKPIKMLSRRIILTSTLFLITIFCSMADEITYRDLNNLLRSKDVEIGIAVYENGKRVLGVNEFEKLPMMSVMKFPLALTVADYIEKRGLSLNDSITIGKGELSNETYSPMLKKYDSEKTHSITIGELLDYSLSQSDNNACDILLRFVGGPKAVNHYLTSIGFNQINVRYNEKEMAEDNENFLHNYASADEMAKLMDILNRTFNSPLSLEIKRLMESSETGRNRIPKGLQGEKAVIGHKTGTGYFDEEKGVITALNDAGYVNLADGNKYSLAVFIANSPYSLEETEAIIAKVSEIIARQFTARNGRVRTDALGMRPN